MESRGKGRAEAITGEAESGQGLKTKLLAGADRCGGGEAGVGRVGRSWEKSNEFELLDRSLYVDSGRGASPASLPVLVDSNCPFSNRVSSFTVLLASCLAVPTTLRHIGGLSNSLSSLIPLSPFSKSMGVPNPE